MARLCGMSPFLGSDDVETIVNVREVNYDVDEDFGEDFASYRAINFVEQLLVRNPRFICIASLCLCNFF